MLKGGAIGMAFNVVTGDVTLSHEAKQSWQKQVDEAGRHALDAAATRAADAGDVPEDLRPDGWRRSLLTELVGLSDAIYEDYINANKSQRKQAWEYRWAGPLATGLGAGFGAAVTGVGTLLVGTSKSGGWAVAAVGLIIAVAGSVVSSNNYVANRNKTLRFLRLIFDINDYVIMLLPSAKAGDAFTQIDTFRQLWESAGI